MVSGKVSNDCRYKGKPSCLDRADDLIPAGIRPWQGKLPAEKAAAVMIGDVITRYRLLDDAPVRVRGWLGECRRLSCQLYEGADYQGARLSLGASDTFDRRAARLASRWVMVEGRVNAFCLDTDPHPLPNDEVLVTGCTDRADDLRNPRIVAVYPDNP